MFGRHNNQESTPTPSINPETINHSGDLGLEVPVYEFTNEDGTPMTLEQALNAGVITKDAPDTIADHVDPTKSQTTEAFVPFDNSLTPAEKQQRSKRKSIVTAIAGAAAATTALAVFSLGQGNDDTHEANPRQQPSTSATINPGAEPIAEPGSGMETVSPETLVGTPSTELETLNVPAPETLRQGIEPVSIADFPNAAEAAAQFGILYNLRQLSGVIDYPNTGLNETSASLAQRSEMDSIMFEGASPENFEDENTIRLLLATEFYMINDMKMFSTNTTPTFNLSWKPGEVTQVNQDEFIVQVRETISTNILTIDPSFVDNYHGVDIAHRDGTVTLVKLGDSWVIREMAISQEVVGE